ncbi:MAG: four-carbon acid sugar kinase family protein [Bryobacterales bacterium]|nr:four-carbon acid sugar kinase family protein [Bryobacterales bacterium]
MEGHTSREGNSCTRGPAAPVLAWYGDDFTGSTDVMEMLSLHGRSAVLFLERPDARLLARFASYQAFGLAGSSRSRSPEWMDAELPLAFGFLKALGTPLLHYKVCSTFDSSPQVGSIGRAMEIGQRVTGSRWVPIVAGAPAMSRFTFFGHLFAANAGEVFRIDRHPTMSRHPVTPMDEADLRVHLAKQTARRIGLMSFRDVVAADAAERLSQASQNHDAVLFDVIDAATLAGTGRLLWDQAQQAPLFVVGSSGVEHALAAGWGAQAMPNPANVPVSQVLVLSGSCSPMTSAQIATAVANGFAAVRLDPVALGNGDRDAMQRAVAEAIAAWRAGRSVVMYSAGHDAVQLDRDISGRPGFRESLGELSGRALCAVLDACPEVRRVVVAGGDTSSWAGSLLGVQALTFVCSLAPGAPLCRAWSNDAQRDGIEIVFKGGQCGAPEFFLQVRGDRT